MKSIIGDNDSNSSSNNFTYSPFTQIRNNNPFLRNVSESNKSMVKSNLGDNIIPRDNDKLLKSVTTSEIKSRQIDNTSTKNLKNNLFGFTQRDRIQSFNTNKITNQSFPLKNKFQSILQPIDQEHFKYENSEFNDSMVYSEASNNRKSFNDQHKHYKNSIFNKSSIFVPNSKKNSIQKTAKEDLADLPEFEVSYESMNGLQKSNDSNKKVNQKQSERPKSKLLNKKNKLARINLKKDICDLDNEKKILSVQVSKTNNDEHIKKNSMMEKMTKSQLLPYKRKFYNNKVFNNLEKLKIQSNRSNISSKEKKKLFTKSLRFNRLKNKVKINNNTNKNKRISLKEKIKLALFTKSSINSKLNKKLNH